MNGILKRPHNLLRSQKLHADSLSWQGLGNNTHKNILHFHFLSFHFIVAIDIRLAVKHLGENLKMLSKLYAIEE
jgi:hypothetical protein